MKIIKGIGFALTALIIVIGIVFILLAERSAKASIANLNSEASYTLKYCKTYSTNLGLPDKGEYCIFGESISNEYYLAYAGTPLEKDTLIYGEKQRDPVFYWAVKVEDGVFTSSWVSRNKLTSDQLRSYSYDEQLDQVKLLNLYNTENVIGYYTANDN